MAFRSNRSRRPNRSCASVHARLETSQPFGERSCARQERAVGCILSPLLRSGGEVPRSDGGRPAARGWSENGRTQKPASITFLGNDRASGTQRSVGFPRNSRIHHPGAGRGQRLPLLVEEGNQIVQSHTRDRHVRSAMQTYWVEVFRSELDG